MTTTTTTSTTTSTTPTTDGTASALTGLPHWESVPTDLPSATAEVKQALRDRITAAGRTIAEVIAEVEDFVRAEIADIEATRARGEEVWPVIDYADVEAGTVSDAQLALLQRRGCAVVRGHFERSQAEAWDRDIVDYVDSNHFFENYSGPADDFFDTLEMSKPEIYPVYWSHAQMEARQHPRMATVQAFLNSRWRSTSGARRGSTRRPTRSIPTGSGGVRPAPTPAVWAPTSIPAPWICG